MADVQQVPCYARGTRILTQAGEVAVEALKIGDRVMTRAGHAKPIQWIGRRDYEGARNYLGILPILIRKGALGENRPHRDLYVSPRHALFLENVLVPAECLVNGVSIERCRTWMGRLEYFHIELAAHDVIIAEGAAAETYADCDNRDMFANADEFWLLNPDAQPQRWALCAPKCQSGPVLERIRHNLAQRAGATARAPGTAAG